MEILYLMLAIIMAGIFYCVGFLNGSTKKIVNPIEAHKEKKEAKIQQMEYDLKQRQDAANMHNVDVYDGSPVGQMDIPNE